MLIRFSFFLDVHQSGIRMRMMDRGGHPVYMHPDFKGSWWNQIRQGDYNPSPKQSQSFPQPGEANCNLEGQNFLTPVRKLQSASYGGMRGGVSVCIVLFDDPVKQSCLMEPPRRVRYRPYPNTPLRGAGSSYLATDVPGTALTQTTLHGVLGFPHPSYGRSRYTLLSVYPPVSCKNKIPSS